MRRALLCLVLAACSTRATSRNTPSVEDVRARVHLRCEQGYGGAGALFCREAGNPLEATIHFDRAETPETAKVTSFTLALEAPSADAAFAQLRALLDGLVPAGHVDGIRARLSGPGAEKSGEARPVSLEGVDVTSSVTTLEGGRQRFHVEVWYR